VAGSRAAITIVKTERLLDPRSGNVLSPAAALVDGDKIKEVGPPAQIRAHGGATPIGIDLGGATLMPGLIEPGKFADLVPVTGDPLGNITEFERIRFVMKDGRVIRNDFQENHSK
jgi:imidazolonepropionase-like amidohydrolase